MQDTKFSVLASLAVLLLLGVASISASAYHHSKQQHLSEGNLHQPRQATSCNLRIVREIARRVCSFHSEEHTALSRYEAENDLQLQYYKKILHTCCPDGCPGLIKLCI